MNRFLALICLFISLSVQAQIETNSVVPQFSDQKIEKIPERKDDIETENLLKEMTKKSGWFPEINIKVSHGIVVIEGRANNQNQLSWLAKTAEKLPTTIAVINKAEIITPPLTDMSPFFKELKSIVTLIKKHLPRVVFGFLIASIFIFLGYRIQRFSTHMWRRRISNVFLAGTVSRLVLIPVWLMFFYLTLMTVGLQSLAGTIIGGTGLLGIIFGFAFKGIAENYLSGLLLAIRSPFTKGDAIRIGDNAGIVQSLNMRGTTILDWDGNLVLIPNINVIQSVVKNLSANPFKRSTFLIGVGLCEPANKCQELITEALKTIPGIDQNRAPSVSVEDITSSTIVIRVYYWFNAKEASESNLKSLAIVKSKEILIANGISLPDTAREIVLTDPLKVLMLQDTKELEANTEKKLEEQKTKASENFEAASAMNQNEQDHEDELKKIAEVVSLPGQESDSGLLQKH